MSVSVIIPSINRPSLIRTVASVLPQLEDEDEILVQVDHPRHNDYGNWARDRCLAQSSGTHVWFLDDDDEAAPGALEAMRAAIKKDAESAWVFKLVQTDGTTIWNEWRVGSPNTTGTSLLIPRAKAPRWCTGGGVMADGTYAQMIAATCNLRFSEAIVALLRPKSS